MPATINDLPYELLSAILQDAAELNIQQGSNYTYGLSQAPEPLQDAPMQRVVRGQLSPDTLRWTVAENIRQVRRQWHDWAAEYALETLYISRWRGSERWAWILGLLVLPFTDFYNQMDAIQNTRHDPDKPFEHRRVPGPISLFEEDAPTLRSQPGPCIMCAEDMV